MRTKQIEQDIHRFQEALSKADADVDRRRCPAFPHPPALLMTESVSSVISLMLKQDMAFTICTPAGFSHSRRWKEQWAYWSRFIYVNRYCDPPKPVYSDLLRSVKDKDYFVLTTNVDHCFQRAGFDKRRLFYTQGDYGLWQCSAPCHHQTYDNEEIVRQMVEAQGFRTTKEGLKVPDGITISMSVPSELIPRCPRCGRLISMNLRAGNTFVQDAGWYAAAERYDAFNPPS